jgi:hypothetical protein
VHPEEGTERGRVNAKAEVREKRSPTANRRRIRTRVLERRPSGKDDGRIRPTCRSGDQLEHHDANVVVECRRAERAKSKPARQACFFMKSYFVWSGSACIERVFSDPGAQRNHLAENVVTSRHRKKRGKKESSDGKRPRPDVDLTSAPLAGSSSHTNAFDSIRSEQSRLPSPHDGP